MSKKEKILIKLTEIEREALITIGNLFYMMEGRLFSDVVGVDIHNKIDQLTASRLNKFTETFIDTCSTVATSASVKRIMSTITSYIRGRNHVITKDIFFELEIRTEDVPVFTMLINTMREYSELVIVTLDKLQQKLLQDFEEAQATIKAQFKGHGVKATLKLKFKGADAEWVILYSRALKYVSEYSSLLHVLNTKMGQ
jgi:hypothetical protein